MSVTPDPPSSPPLNPALHPALLVRIAAYLYIAHILLLGKIALLELTAFWSIFYVGWALGRREARFSFHILFFPLLVYGIVSTLSAVSALTAGRRMHEYAGGMLWFKMLIFPAAILLLRQVPRLREWLVYVYAIFGGGIACWGLIEYAGGRRDLEHRINGPVSHVMTFSGLLMVMSLLFLVLWWHQRKLWQLAVTAVATLALLLTYTRGAWIGWGAAVLVLVLTTRARRLAWYAVPVVILAITFLPLDLFGRLVSTFDLQQTSNFDRIRMTEAGIEMIRDYPVLGVGPANVKETYALYRKHDAPRARPAHLHSNVIQLWAERGILGLAAYVVFVALFLRQCVRAWNGPNRMWAEAGVLVATSLTVAGLFEFNFGDTEVFYLMLNVFAYIAVSLEQQPQPSPNTPLPSLVPATT